MPCVMSRRNGALHQPRNRPVSVHDVVRNGEQVIQLRQRGFFLFGEQVVIQRAVDGMLESHSHDLVKLGARDVAAAGGFADALHEAVAVVPARRGVDDHVGDFAFALFVPALAILVRARKETG